MSVSPTHHAAMIALAAVMALGFGAAAQQGTPDYAALVAAPDRKDTDREIDKRRDPVKLLAFTGVRPGMKVLDMGAGGGYSTELMVRAVGAGGIVYAQNGPSMNERAKANFEARMKTPAMAKATALIRPFDDPVPADLRDLDLITFFFAYHDTTYMPVDRVAMNRRMFAALKPGGALVVADHSARAGDGVAVGRTLHRIEESALRAEIEAAGFKLVASGDFLRRPSDARDFSSTRPTGPVDEFVLKFEKPR